MRSVKPIALLPVSRIKEEAAAESATVRIGARCPRTVGQSAANGKASGSAKYS